MGCFVAGPQQNTISKLLSDINTILFHQILRRFKQECAVGLLTDHVFHTEFVRHGVVDHELHFADVPLNPLEVCGMSGKKEDIKEIQKHV